MIVSGGAYLLHPSEKAVVAVLTLDGETDDEYRSWVRSNWSDWLLSEGAAFDGSNGDPLPWSISPRKDGSLELRVGCNDRERASLLARRLAVEFVAAHEKESAILRERPSEGEAVLSDLSKELAATMREAQSQLDQSVASMPRSDPRTDRDAMLTRWQSLRSDFITTQEEISAFSDELARLDITENITHALVTSEKREEALAADESLQQDLEELRTRLSDLKLHVLNVWQRSSGSLEALRAAADQMLQNASPSDSLSPTDEVHRQIEPIRTSATAYRGTLLAFFDPWTGEFLAVKQDDLDPRSTRLLDAYHSLRIALNDFLFRAGQQLSEIRAKVATVGESTGNAARLHVYQSQLVRAFQTVQSAHHKFEFEAGTLETPENFRLDAALKTARGLHRRIQDRTQSIDFTLQEEARRLLTERQALEEERAHQRLANSRRVSDEMVERMLALQELLNQSIGETEGFLRSAITAELAANRLDETKRGLSNLEARMAKLAAGRAACYAPGRVSLSTIELRESSAPQRVRIRVCAIAGALTFLAVLAFQFLSTRGIGYTTGG